MGTVIIVQLDNYALFGQFQVSATGTGLDCCIHDGWYFFDPYGD
jgi:hypothetical protein